jgi:HAMP domain-containing protein
MEAFNQGRRGTSGAWTLVAAALLGLLAMVAAYNSWSSGRTASRSDVATAMGSLDPSCRPLVAARMRDRLIREGRPLERGEVSGLAQGLRDCADIGQQLAGLGDV